MFKWHRSDQKEFFFHMWRQKTRMMCHFLFLLLLNILFTLLVWRADKMSHKFNLMVLLWWMFADDSGVSSDDSYADNSCNWCKSAVCFGLVMRFLLIILKSLKIKHVILRVKDHVFVFVCERALKLSPPPHEYLQRLKEAASEPCTASLALICRRTCLWRGGRGRCFYWIYSPERAENHTDRKKRVHICSTFFFWVITTLNSNTCFPCGAANESQHKTKKTRRILQCVCQWWSLFCSTLAPISLKLKLNFTQKQRNPSPCNLPDKENVAIIIHREMIRASSSWGEIISRAWADSF